MSSIIELESRYSSGVYAKRDLVIVKGKGAKLWDENDRQYIDCVGGIGVANIGHCNPYVIKAIKEQSEKLITCPEIFYNDQRAILLEKLVQITGLNRVFLCNSGTEAVEGALKFARLSTGKKEIISTMRAFHGRTLGALSATWEKKYRTPFEPLVPGFKHVPFNNFKAVEEAVTYDTAAIIVEIVQGEGGIRGGNSEYFTKLQEFSRKSDFLLIVDEVQTGFGRTGRLFACQHYDLKPDILCMAKSLAGGLPMGAFCFGERIKEVPKHIHGCTFGGNPISSAAALASIQYIEDYHLPERAAELGKYLMNELNAINSKLIREVRGMGLMVGIELKVKVGDYLNKLAEKGVLALPAGHNVLRLLPPLVIEKEDLDVVVEKIGEVLGG